MIFLILAAGKSTRFTEKGYVEKPYLPLSDGRSMLEWVISKGPTPCKTMLAYRDGNMRMRQFLLNTIKRLDIAGEIIPTNPRSKDPFETLKDCCQFLYGTDELVISFVDVFMQPNINNFIETCRNAGCDAGMVVFKAKGNRFQRTKDGKYARGGLFYFKSARYTALRIKAMSFEDGQDHGPSDVVFTHSGWYKYILQPDEYIDLGTPEDYERFIK